MKSTKRVQYLSLIIILFFHPFIAYPQKEGYKNVILGRSIKEITQLGIYKISQIADTGYRLQNNLKEVICDEPIDFIDILLNKDSIIQQVQVYTVAVVYKDVDDFLNKYKIITECMSNTFQEDSYNENGNDRPDGRMMRVWKFVDKNILLGFYAYNLSIDAKNVPRHFLISWAYAAKEVKIW